MYTANEIELFEVHQSKNKKRATLLNRAIMDMRLQIFSDGHEGIHTNGYSNRSEAQLKNINKIRIECFHMHINLESRRVQRHFVHIYVGYNVVSRYFTKNWDLVKGKIFYDPPLVFIMQCTTSVKIIRVVKNIRSHTML